MSDLKVWWIPQVPGKKFEVPVKNIDEAIILLRTLADYDAFQYENNIKPDYCNAGGLITLEDGEWIDWYDGDGNDIDDIIAIRNSAPAPRESEPKSEEDA